MNMISKEETKYGTAASRWAGLGPYYAMFPTSFAVDIIREYTTPGQIVLDPFAGRSTSLFAAASEHRCGIGIEINPVGWVYGKAKLQTATRASVEKRLKSIAARAKVYRSEAALLPAFFRMCFCKGVREFLVAARDMLDWRRQKTDWTTMALLLVDLHGKRDAALSNQMRQTKAMAPSYAMRWWREHDLSAPERDPLEFMLKKVAWRYAKGRPVSTGSRVYLGDSRTQLNVLANASTAVRAGLLFTSPPYHGVTNYFYDQWLRIWLLGGPCEPRSTGEACKRKFENKRDYEQILTAVFQRSKRLLARSAVIYVRTDSRKFTRDKTIEVLERVFPEKKLRIEEHSKPKFTQTELFDSERESKGETDLVMW